MALLLLGSTFTLYGGSVLTRWIFAPASSRLTSSSSSAVAAEQSMLTELPEIPAPRLGLRRCRWNGLRIPGAAGGRPRHQNSHRIFRPPEDIHVETGAAQRRELCRQQRHVPLRELPGAVVRDAIRADLPRREPPRDVHRNLLEAEALRRFVAGVPDDDDALSVDDDRLSESKLLDRLGDRGNRLIVLSRIPRVGADSIDGTHFDLHKSSFLRCPRSLRGAERRASLPEKNILQKKVCPGPELFAADRRRGFSPGRTREKYFEIIFLVLGAITPEIRRAADAMEMTGLEPATHAFSWRFYGTDSCPLYQLSYIPSVSI